MSNWQITFTSGAGQVMTFGLEAPDKTSAFQHGLLKIPFIPERFSIAEIKPLCARHHVRHNCPDEVNLFEQPFE
jgi:hypothetical protein